MPDANLLKSSCISLDNFVIASISMLALKTSDELGTVLPSPLLFSQEQEHAQLVLPFYTARCNQCQYLHQTVFSCYHDLSTTR